jgi:hypothetical protein
VPPGATCSSCAPAAKPRSAAGILTMIMGGL